MIDSIRLAARIEQLEAVYADITDGRPLIKAQEGARFVFDDEAHACSLADALATGEALVGFAINMLRQ